MIKRGIDTNAFCFLCRKKEESMDHVLWSCKTSKKVWHYFFPNLTGFYDLPRMGRDSISIWRRLTEQMQEGDIYTTVRIVCAIWHYRNSSKIKASLPDLNQIIKVMERSREEELNLFSGEKSPVRPKNQSSHGRCPPQFLEDQPRRGVGWKQRLRRVRMVSSWLQGFSDLFGS